LLSLLSWADYLATCSDEPVDFTGTVALVTPIIDIIGIVGMIVPRLG
jgi:hypothetical protein